MAGHFIVITAFPAGQGPVRGAISLRVLPKAFGLP